MKNTEQLYIKKRKRKAFFDSLCYWICSILPIDKKRITICSFEGRGGFGCNPKYIVEELYRRDAGYEFIWLVNDMEKEFPEYIKKVKNSKWTRAYWLSTSKIWIDNYRKPLGTRKRNGQVYINTWHGTLCIKPIGRYRGDLLPKIAQIVSEEDSKLIDYVLSGSAWCDMHYRDGLLYDGPIIRTGSPRCDILFNQREQMKLAIREKYNIPADAKILMYAPTFRGGGQSTDRKVGAAYPQIDYSVLIDALEKRFGGDWYILLRLHPQLAAQNESFQLHSNADKLRDVTQSPDMNELIAGVDCFITDYSSAIFEACLMKIPCFIYADDLEEYIKERGGLFFDMETLPFPVAINHEELIDNIQEFDKQKYNDELNVFIKKEDITEDGFASKRVASFIEDMR